MSPSMHLLENSENHRRSQVEQEGKQKILNALSPSCTSNSAGWSYKSGLLRVHWKVQMNKHILFWNEKAEGKETKKHTQKKKKNV